MNYRVAIALLTLLACVRVAMTHRVFSQVLDEPAHLAAGFQWFDSEYRIDPSHPPLARILGALPLRFDNFPRVYGEDYVARGNDLLEHGNRYHKTLARARIGNLLLLILACVFTAAWARRLTSPAIAILAVAFLTTMPTVLGHAGVLTTDLAALAAIAFALFAFDLFLEQPTLRRGALLGIAIGFGLLAKFSFLVFFPPCAAFALIARRPRFAWSAAFIAALVAFFVLWTGYRFEFRTARAYAGDTSLYVFEYAAPKPLSRVARKVAAYVPLPAPAFFFGLGLLKLHDAGGHDALLFGEARRMGWWYYFPVVFFYKTPIAFLLLVLWGAIIAARTRDRRILACLLMAASIMAVAMTSSINIGVRHVLPIYVPLSIVAAFGVHDLWQRGRGRIAAGVLMAWLVIGGAFAHPDYLAWFNELAGPNPAHIAVDSNLDWGQDSMRLVYTLREMQIARLHLDLLSNLSLERHGIEAIPFDPTRKTSGWLAVSESQLAFRNAAGQYAWLRAYQPERRIGKSIRLYNIP